MDSLTRRRWLRIWGGLYVARAVFTAVDGDWVGRLLSVPLLGCMALLGLLCASEAPDMRSLLAHRSVQFLAVALTAYGVLVVVFPTWSGRLLVTLLATAGTFWVWSRLGARSPLPADVQ